MKTRNKVLLTLVCAVALVAGSVLGTYAYLTSQDTVTNTFTVGNVEITLDEADVKTDGTLESTIDTRVDANEYHLMPGHLYIKDPIVHVDAASENSWLFVKVENGISNIEATDTDYLPNSTTDTYKTIATQMSELGWTPITAGSNIYYYNRIVVKNENIPTFSNFMVAGNVDNSTLSAYTTAGNSVKITVTAYAVQADGFATAPAAWNATFGV